MYCAIILSLNAKSLEPVLIVIGYKTPSATHMDASSRLFNCFVQYLQVWSKNQKRGKPEFGGFQNPPVFIEVQLFLISRFSADRPSHG